MRSAAEAAVTVDLCADAMCNAGYVNVMCDAAYVNVM